MNDDKLQSAVDAIRKEIERVGAAEYELYLGSFDNLSIEVKDGERDAMARSVTAGASLRLVRDGRTGFSYSTDLGADALARMVSNAWDSAPHLSPERYTPFAPAGEIAPLEGIDNPETARLSEQEQFELARELEAATLASDERVKRVRKASVGRSLSRVRLVTSGGCDAGFARSLVHTGVLAVAEAGGESEMGWDDAFGFTPGALDVKAVGAKAAGNALRSLGGGKPATGAPPVILENTVAGELLGVLAGSFSAESVDKGTSMLAGKVGESIASTLITVVDDGRRTDGAAAEPFDDEGVAHRQLELISAGELKGYLYDRYYGAKSGKSEGGNAVRGGFKAPPSPGPSNLLILPGESDFESLLSQVGDGVLITDLLGLHTADPVTGDFSVGAAGIEIKGGELGRALKGFAAAGNLLELLRDIRQVGSDLRFSGSIGAPSLMVASLSLGGE